MPSPEEAFADTILAIGETLALIVRQLTEQRFLNEDLLISDLVDLAQDFEARRLFESAAALPDLLVSLVKAGPSSSPAAGP